MDKFVRELLAEWRRLELPFDSATVIVAVSGGADSLSLLAALADLVRRGKLRIRLVAAHFDHALRTDSRKDADFVASLARDLGVEFAGARAEGDLRISRRGNLEQNARRARYGFLASVAGRESAAAVVTAHTVDDQAETFLLNLIRGSGADGLKAIAAVSREFAIGDAFPAFLLVRPLIGWATREATEAFCRRIGFEPVIDPMNADHSFRRVRIRRELIPLLKTFNPQIVGAIARTSSNLTSATPIDPVFEKAPNVSELEKLGNGELRAGLRAWLRRERGDLRRIGQRNIAAVEQLVRSRKSGKTVEIPGGSVVKSGGRIRFLPRPHREIKDE